MRVLFATSGWPTHFYMKAPLAMAFRAAGHDVLVAGPPGCRDAVVRGGLPMACVGRDIDFIAIRKQVLPYEAQWQDVRYSDDDGIDEWLAEVRRLAEFDEVRSGWQEANFSSTADLVVFARAWRPDLIVTDTMSVGPMVAGLVIGVPVVRHLLATDSMGDEKVYEELPGFREHFEEYGVRLEGTPAAWTVDPSPPSMQPQAYEGRLQMRWVPYNGPGVMPDWLLAPPERPRVCVTWGTSSAWSAGEDTFLVPQVIRALLDLDVEIVVTLGRGQRRLLGTPPDGVRVLESFPLHMLMPSCALLVHQGGSSAMLTAAHHGVTQLAIPYLPEQILDARAHASTGAGLWIFGDGEADEHAIHAAAAALLHNPSYPAAAERLRREIAQQPSPQETAAELERLVSAGVP